MAARASRSVTRADVRHYAGSSRNVCVCRPNGCRSSVAIADVRGSQGRTDIDFNVSNTSDIALVGVADSPGLRIGVDVESEDRMLNHAGLARKYLTSREQAAIASADDDAHRRAFLRLWTCKEAMSKATGQALSAPLRKLDVELDAVVASRRRAGAVHCRRLAFGSRRCARRLPGHRRALATARDCNLDKPGGTRQRNTQPVACAGRPLTRPN